MFPSFSGIASAGWNESIVAARNPLPVPMMQSYYFFECRKTLLLINFICLCELIGKIVSIFGGVLADEGGDVDGEEGEHDDASDR